MMENAIQKADGEVVQCFRGNMSFTPRDPSFVSGQGRLDMRVYPKAFDE